MTDFSRKNAPDKELSSAGRAQHGLPSNGSSRRRLVYPIRDGETGDSYQPLGLPATFFIDRDGVIASSFTGPFVEADRGTNVQRAIDPDELKKQIEEILE